MKRQIMLALLLLPTASTAYGQIARVPKFSQYPAKIERARVKSIDFKNNPKARKFRTVLKLALNGGVNFAGHYVVTHFGQGTNVSIGAIIDTRNGRVYFPERLDMFGWGLSMVDHANNSIDNKNDSRLLILYGCDGKDGNWGTHYYLWTGNKLKKIAFDPKTDVPE